MPDNPWGMITRPDLSAWIYRKESLGGSALSPNPPENLEQAQISYALEYDYCIHSDITDCVLLLH